MSFSRVYGITDIINSFQGFQSNHMGVILTWIQMKFTWFQDTCLGSTYTYTSYLDKEEKTDS